MDTPLTASTGLDDSHKAWIAECLMREFEADDIAASLMAKGFSQEVVYREIEAAAAHPYLIAGTTVARQLKKRDWLLEIYRKVSETSKFSGTVERRKNLSGSEFLEQYYSTNRPVILTDLMRDWKALDLWTPDYLREKYGHHSVEVQTGRTSDPIYEHNAHLHKTMMRFSDFVDQVVSVSESNDFYLTGNNMNQNAEVFQDLFQDIRLFNEYLDPSRDNNLAYFWFGPAGTITKLHHDLSSGLLAQVRGRKLVKLVSPFDLPRMYHYLNYYSQVDLDQPDEAQFPLFQEVRIREIILEPGEVLFVPITWWHYVRALDVSISLSFSNFKYPNHYQSFYDTYGKHPSILD